MVPLGEVTEQVVTWNPRHSAESTFEYIELGAVDNQTKRITGSVTVSGANAPSRARQCVAKGDVLVSTVRPNLNAVAMVAEPYDGATASTGFAVLRPTAELDPRYLFHWVQSPRFVAAMMQKVTGASYPAVSDKMVRKSQMPFPSIDEQRRVAAILDRADGLRTKRREIRDRLNDFTPSLFHEMFGSAADPRWQRVLLGEVVDRLESGTSKTCEARPVVGDEWGILKLGAVTYGAFDPRENKAYLGDVGGMVSNEVRSGDVLMTRKNTRQLVGAVALVGNVRPRLLMPDLIFRLHLDKTRIERRYFQALMMSPTMRVIVRGLANGAAASMSNISKANLRNLSLPLPPIELQRQFSSRVEQSGQQLASAKHALALHDELFAALQSRAFRGEL